MDDGSCRNDPIQDMIHDAFGYHPNDETMDEVGVSRGEVWIATHKRSDGSAVNDAASVIIDKITSYEASGSCSSQEVSQYDSLAMALGSQEHSGRVRGLGLGPTPSQVFGVRARGRSSDPTYTEMQNELTQLRRKVIENEEQTRLKDAKLERMQAFQTSLLQSLPGYLPSQVLQNLEALNEGISQSPPSCNQRDGQPPPDS
ncbi:LOB domain-containing protein 18-like [Senna tora]|uniref:LOB domain-containing protein 18-like n=1 Tax=Senna tora TaxID=362788 RepID=A0A834TM77_9FABA|nr:LOB domain-containing protein 18-like [Senna tora]